MPGELIDVLTEVGKPVASYASPDGSRLLILPYGGRVLGLFSAASAENFYWTHPALEQADTARAFYASDAWHNSGGDRTWLAPEADVFLPNYPSAEGYFQPRQLDPGAYVVRRQGDRIELCNRLRLNLSRSRREIAVTLTKALGPAPNPLRYEGGLPGLRELEYAGYAQTSSLLIEGNDAEQQGPVGLWNLVQMPHGGELLIATYYRSPPRIIFGQIGPDEVRLSERLIRYRMAADGDHKLSIRAAAATGRVGYLYPSGDRWALIVRNFFVNPSGEYVDVPWDEPAALGFGVQACNVKSGMQLQRAGVPHPGDRPRHRQRPLPRHLAGLGLSRPPGADPRRRATPAGTGGLAPAVPGKEARGAQRREPFLRLETYLLVAT